MNGGFAQDVAALLGGGVLLASFLLLARGGVVVLAAQGVLVALLAAWQGLLREEMALLAAAALLVVAKGVFVPLLLARITARAAPAGVDGQPPAGVMLAAGLGLLALAVLALPPALTGGAAAARVEMTLGLSVLLIGLMAMAASRGVAPRLAGLAAAENGLLLGAIAIPGLPLLLAYCALLPMLVAGLGLGVVALGLRAGPDGPEAR
jgi:hydrogenase-4 component E